MFLNDTDFYQLRRITLSDLLDSESGYRLTSKCIVNAKKSLLQILNPDLAQKRQSKKRNRDQFEANQEDYTEKIVEYFEHEDQLASYYSRDGDRRINLEEIPELEGQPLYAVIDEKEISSTLDLKPPVVLTMLNQLEQVDGSFFKVSCKIPAFFGVRFHKETLEELAETDSFYKAFNQAQPVPHQGVYRVSTVRMAQTLGVKPYNVPRIFFAMQHNGKDQMTYSTDNESFILELKSIPSAGATIPLAKAMLEATRKIESALVQKLNCMYFVSRKISLPSVESLLKREKSFETSKEMYLEFSEALNILINAYFCIEKEEDMEI